MKSARLRDTYTSVFAILVMVAKIGNQHMNGERKCDIYVCISLSVKNSESMSFAAYNNWGHYVT